NSMQAAIWWKGAHRGTERAEYFGDKMSFFFPNPHGLGASIVRKGQSLEKDSGGFERHRNEFAAYTVPEWWNTELLPPSLRHSSGHEGSHTFITHEFIDALVRDRRPAIDVYEAIAY